MLGQYSKVAMGKLGQIIPMKWDNNTKEFTIPLNLNFEPKRLLILINASDAGPGSSENTYINNPKEGDVIKLDLSNGLGYKEWFKVVQVNKNEIKFSFMTYSDNYASIYFLEYIAIG